MFRVVGRFTLLMHLLAQQHGVRSQGSGVSFPDEQRQLFGHRNRFCLCLCYVSDHTDIYLYLDRFRDWSQPSQRSPPALRAPQLPPLATSQLGGLPSRIGKNWCHLWLRLIAKTFALLWVVSIAYSEPALISLGLFRHCISFNYFILNLQLPVSNTYMISFGLNSLRPCKSRRRE